MPDLSYRERAHFFARERIYRLGDDALEIVAGGRCRTLPYRDIEQIEAVSVRLLGGSAPFQRWIIRPERGAPLPLTAATRDGLRVTDRRTAWNAFARELHSRILAANPEVYFVEGRPLYNRAGGLGGKLVVRMFRAVRRIGPDRCADICAWFARRIGPLTRGHRRALEQLAIAFPEKTDAERRRIAVGMWDNLARTIVEYSQLETFWQHDPAHPERSRIVRTPENTRIWEDIKRANRPTLHFSLHIANWELAAIAGVGYVRCLIPYRRMKNRAFTEELVRIRVAAGITPIAAGAAMIAEIKREFGPGDGLGMLIDQRYAHGIEVEFFGRPTLLNPLFARLARIYDCPIYGSRIIRRPDRRFGYEIVPVEPVRDARGRVDVHATTQAFASLMERWIREHPDQWMWLHRIWR